MAVDDNLTDNRDRSSTGTVGVAEAKRRFSELLDRVRSGERFVVSRHGKRAAAIVPPDEAATADADRGARKGMLSLVGALSDWSELDAMTDELYAARRRSADRPAPDLG